MLVVPLGLGTRIRRLPIITLAIATLWIFVFAFDRQAGKLGEVLLSIAAKSGMRDATRQLFVEYCQDHHGSKAACERYAVLLWTGFPAKSTGPLGLSRASGAELQKLEREHESADRLRESLSSCDGSPSCFKYKDIVWRFSSDSEHHRNLAALRSLPAYGEFSLAERSYLNGLRRICGDWQCLVHGNINLNSVLWSQIRHGSILHLCSNLLALLIFGIYAEQRTSRWLFAAVVVIGGSIGMIVHTQFFAEKNSIALGGSANVSVIMGMFYVFFFHSRMRFLVWLPRRFYLGSTFFAEVRYCIPLLFVLADLAGSLDNGFTDLLSNKVAHAAHLVGFAVGCLAALIIVAWRRLPSHLIYEGEVDDLRNLERVRDFYQQLRLADRLVHCNPENLRAREIGCATAIRWALKPRFVLGWRLRWRIDYFLRKHLATVCAMHYRQGASEFASELLSSLPGDMPLMRYLHQLGQETILGLADFAVGCGQFLLAVRLYDLYLLRFPQSSHSPEIAAFAGDLINRMPMSMYNTRAVELYVRAQVATPLSMALKSWLTQVAEDCAS
jgi:membrane associated rhomboid family serine protease